MTTANELIVRALRLINQPGRGARLAPEDLTNAFEALQEILDSEAVSKQFVPGIRRHFFDAIPGRSFIRYGPGEDFDTSAFGNLAGDPAPLAIEFGQILQGSAILDRELVDEYRFRNVGTWVVDANATLANNEYRVETPGAATSSTQPIVSNQLVQNRTYTIRISATVTSGQVSINVREAAVAFDSFVIDSSGDYEFDFVWTGDPANLPDIELATANATDDLVLTLVSIVERNKDRLELPDGQGSYYTMLPYDQDGYNRQFTKGNQGRPYRYLYTREAGPVGDLRFDNTAIAGDIVVFDVLVNKVAVSNVNETLRINPQAIKWLRYAVADNVASEYGKQLTPRQITIMEDAWNMLASSNRRMNTLAVPRALRQRRRFDINRGDP